MKQLRFYQTKLRLKGRDDVFNYLVNNLKPSNRTWTYFVDWGKVRNQVSSIEIELNTLNYLIGKQDFEKVFREVIQKHPSVIPVLPALSVRSGNGDTRFTILVDQKKRKLKYEYFDFNTTKTTKSAVDQYLKFVTKTGFRALIEGGHIKNLVDYMYGVEAGLDSNGRKNRSGMAMEGIVEAFVMDFCKRNKYIYIRGASVKRIKSEFNIDVPKDKASRTYDFAVKTADKLFLIETNFYGGGGSKLKSVAGEFRVLQRTLAKKGFQFIWITDGLGWETTVKALRETFDANDYTFNLAMLEHGILDALIKR